MFLVIAVYCRQQSPGYVVQSLLSTVDSRHQGMLLVIAVYCRQQTPRYVVSHCCLLLIAGTRVCCQSLLPTVHSRHQGICCQSLLSTEDSRHRGMLLVIAVYCRQQTPGCVVSQCCLLQIAGTRVCFQSIAVYCRQQSPGCVVSQCCLLQIAGTRVCC